MNYTKTSFCKSQPSHRFKQGDIVHWKSADIYAMITKQGVGDNYTYVVLTGILSGKVEIGQCITCVLVKAHLCVED